MTDTTETLTALLAEFKRLGWSTAGWWYFEGVGDWCYETSMGYRQAFDGATQTDLDTLLGIGVREFRARFERCGFDLCSSGLVDFSWGRDVYNSASGTDEASALLAACRQLPTPKETTNA